MIKTACKNSEKYKSYGYFIKAYKHDVEHDVTKTVTILYIIAYFRQKLSNPFLHGSYRLKDNILTGVY